MTETTKSKPQKVWVGCNYDTIMTIAYTRKQAKLEVAAMVGDRFNALYKRGAFKIVKAVVRFA